MPAKKKTAKKKTMPARDKAVKKISVPLTVRQLGAKKAWRTRRGERG